MGKGYFVTGIDTNIGKTYVTTQMVDCLRNKGIDAIPYKPIQSGVVNINNKIIGEDVAFYKEKLALTEEHLYYSTYTFETPVSPHLSSKLEDVFIDEQVILEKYKQLENKHDVVFVEGAGGVAVPLKENFGTIDLIKLLNLPVILVTSLKLGTINHTVLTTEYLKSHKINLLGLLINKVPSVMGEMEKDNLIMLEKLTGHDILGVIPEHTDFFTETSILEFQQLLTKNQ
ncbi:dethiobiotin synthase [Gottfriedia acidiceleris]|uniref:ATP-dependent dethiobiotin synthetase BioD n=1 Tax=Gottfriedia acidiceleris TaxID=371036 RepID=A0ABY4JK05_9BACI|nr:dethiobiotin synthase [Gottfriedia acidiceleris]UPM53812.1 dethiobiotin synthase [Gottfriedia acidiceleris]